jgi:hypothetical protein
MSKLTATSPAAPERTSRFCESLSVDTSSMTRHQLAYMSASKALSVDETTSRVFLTSRVSSVSASATITGARCANGSSTRAMRPRTQ